jgi:hypothetical protein
MRTAFICFSLLLGLGAAAGTVEAMHAAQATFDQSVSGAR